MIIEMRTRGLIPVAAFDETFACVMNLYLEKLKVGGGKEICTSKRG